MVTSEFSSLGLPLIQGDQYWRTSGTSPDSGYPKQISAAWHGLPNDIDAAVVWEPNGKGYFFKGVPLRLSLLG